MKEPKKRPAVGHGEEFRLEDFLPHRLSVASEFVSRLLARQYLEEIGLSMAEWRLLAAVGRYGVLSPTAAGEHTDMDKVKVSRAAASLAARGFLKQAHDPNDGRGRLLRLSRKGTTIYAAMPSRAHELEQTVSAALTAAEWNTLQRSLVKVVEHTKSLLTGEA